MTWDVAELGEFATFRNGLNYTRANEGNGLRVINVKDFGDRVEPDYETLGELNPAGLVREDALLRDGDIIFVRSNGNPQLVGRSLLISKPPADISFSAFCIRARLAPTESAKFYSYFFRSQNFREQLSQFGSGTNITNLNQQVLGRMSVPRPPRGEQDRLAETLSAYDDHIANNRRRIELLEQSAKLIFKEWFVHLRYPGHIHDKIVAGVPSGWERTPLENALVLQRGFDLPNQARRSGVIPIYGSTGLSGHHDEVKALAPGVVTGRSGTLGEVHFVRENFWPLNTALWVKEFRRVTPIYAFFMLRQLDLKQYNGGVSVPTLDRKSVHKIEVLVPPHSLIAMFDRLAIPLFEQIGILSTQNGKLTASRDLLLPRLMDGRLTV